MSSVNIGQLPRMELATLEDNDLILMWDVSQHEEFEKFKREKANLPGVNLDTAPKVTRTIRVGDLKSYLNKPKPSLLAKLAKIYGWGKL